MPTADTRMSGLRAASQGWRAERGARRSVGSGAAGPQEGARAPSVCGSKRVAQCAGQARQRLWVEMVVDPAGVAWDRGGREPGPRAARPPGGARRDFPPDPARRPSRRRRPRPGAGGDRRAGASGPPARAGQRWSPPANPPAALEMAASSATGDGACYPCPLLMAMRCGVGISTSVEILYDATGGSQAVSV